MAGIPIDLPAVDDAEECSCHVDAARLEQTLLQARTLIESTVALHRRRRVTASGVTHVPTETTTEALEQLILGARRSVHVALSGAIGFTEPVLHCLEKVPQSVTTRVLCNRTAVDVAHDRLCTLPAVRVYQHELSGLVVVDGTSTLVRSPGTGEEKHGAVIITDAAVVGTLELLYAGVWSRGRWFTDHRELSPRLRTEFTRRVLEQLRSGRTDAAAAHELQVSLRTYRRHVGEIMRRLEATSRFQAGVRAAELGLLPEA